MINLIESYVYQEGRFSIFINGVRFKNCGVYTKKESAGHLVNFFLVILRKLDYMVIELYKNKKEVLCARPDILARSTGSRLYSLHSIPLNLSLFIIVTWPFEVPCREHYNPAIILYFSFLPWISTKIINQTKKKILYTS